MKAVTVNPVLRRELLERWRGKRTFLVFTLYVALLAVVLRFLYWIGQLNLENQARFGGIDATTGPQMGRFLFENLISFVLVLVLFITPGYAAAQISGERERKTLGLLQVTLVRPYQIVAGKLGASVAWVVLLVLAAMPFAGATFFLGGVSLADLMRAVVTVLVIAVSVAGIGIGISSLTRRTTAAVVVTYAVILFLTMGTLVTSLAEFANHEFRNNNNDFGVGDWRPMTLHLNPFYGLADATRADAFSRNFNNGGSLGSVLTPFAFALPTQRTVFGRDQVFIDGPAPAIEFEGRAVVLGDGPADLQVVNDFGQLQAQNVAFDRKPVWLIVLSLYLLMGAGGFATASRRVQPERGPLRRGKRDKDDKADPALVVAGTALADAPPPPPPGDLIVADPLPSTSPSNPPSNSGGGPSVPPPDPTSGGTP